MTRALVLTHLLFAACQCQPEGITDEPERYAEAVCGAVEACGCYPHFESGAVCREELARRFRALLDMDMAFDADCFESVVGGDELPDCAPYSELPLGDWNCIVFRGSKALGEPCDYRFGELIPFGVHECGEGMLCYSGECRMTGQQPYSVVGDACAPEPVQSCLSENFDQDLYCSDAGVCEESPDIGEPCDAPSVCNIAHGFSPAFCPTIGPSAGTCAVPATAGEPCIPEDFFSCWNEVSGWCDPADSICKMDGPAICALASGEKARP
jgi:hypothetical protein